MVRLNTDQVFVTEVDDQAVLLDAVASTYLTANRTGSVIIQALQSGTSLDALVDRVADVFEIDAATARTDCEAFLGELRDRGWLLDSPDDGRTRADV